MNGRTTILLFFSFAGRRARFSKALGEHRENSSGALLFLGSFECEAPKEAERGTHRQASDAESSCMERMMVLSDSRTSAAVEKRAAGCFSRQRRMTLSSSTGRCGAISRRVGGSANWVARMVWKSGASGRWKGWRPVAELVEDEAKSEDVGLNRRLAGDELLGGHVSDSSATSGIGGTERGKISSVCGPGGIKVCLVEREATGEAEVEDLDEAAIGEHDIGGLKVAMKDAKGMCGRETVRDLDPSRENELEAGRTFGNELVEATFRGCTASRCRLLRCRLIRMELRPTS